MRKHSFAQAWTSAGGPRTARALCIIDGTWEEGSLGLNIYLDGRERAATVSVPCEHFEIFSEGHNFQVPSPNSAIYWGQASFMPYY